VNNSLEIHHRTLSHIIEAEAEQVFLQIQKDHQLNWLEINEQLKNSLRRETDPTDNLGQLERLMSYLNFSEIRNNSKHKSQGGLSIIMNTLLQEDPKNKNRKILTLLGGSSYEGFLIEKETMLSFLLYLKEMLTKYKSCVYRNESIFEEIEDFINCNDDFYYITSDDSRYLDNRESFSLVDIMKDDQKLKEFRKIVIDNDFEDLEEIGDYWVENVFDDEENVNFIKTKHSSIDEAIKDLYFENNFTILNMFG
jgi:hypothetical protein